MNRPSSGRPSSDRPSSLMLIGIGAPYAHTHARSAQEAARRAQEAPHSQRSTSAGTQGWERGRHTSPWPMADVVAKGGIGRLR
eukprot:6110746-Prymnesium_polylepis.1